MKKTLYLLSILIIISVFKLNAQETESGGVVKVHLKTIPELIIEQIKFHDENNNDTIDVRENCYFELSIRNAGKTNAIIPTVETYIVNEGNEALLFEESTILKEIKAGKALKFKIPVKGNYDLKTGTSTFEFIISDDGKYKSEPKEFSQSHKKDDNKILLASEWYYPADPTLTVDDKKIKIRLCVNTKEPLMEALVYVNNNMQQILRKFEPKNGSSCNYMIEQEVFLEKGENDIEVKLTNKGRTITSDKRNVIYQPQTTEYRNALVIGNSNYQSAPLRNPVNDAKAMTTTLRKLNFQVIEVLDADRKTMRDSVRKFKERMTQERGVGLFYYAGHGVQTKGENYLIPVNNDIQEEYDIQDEALRANTILSYMVDAGTRMNIVILDACRNNPFSRSMRSGQRGLATIHAEGSGTIIAYATSPGSTASDGDGENGLYTQELLKAIETPGLEIGMVFRRVLANVLKLSGGKQVPWTNSSIVGEFYFSK